MAQVKPSEKWSFRKVLKLVEGLPANEQDDLCSELAKLQELRKALAIGVKELKQGKGVPGEQVFKELRARHAKLAKKRGYKCAS